MCEKMAAVAPPLPVVVAVVVVVVVVVVEVWEGRIFGDFFGIWKEFCDFLRILRDSFEDSCDFRRILRIFKEF